MAIGILRMDSGMQYSSLDFCLNYIPEIFSLGTMNQIQILHFVDIQLQRLGPNGPHISSTNSVRLHHFHDFTSEIEPDVDLVRDIPELPAGFLAHLRVPVRHQNMLSV